MIVRKMNPAGHHIGLHRCPWIPLGTILIPNNITTMNQFGKWLQSKFGEGRYYNSLSAKRYKGFKTVFNGTIKNSKAIGSGKIHYYLAKNKEKQLNQ